MTVHCEQRATVILDADPDADDKELTRLALLELDKSGGAEWETEFGWVDSRELPTPVSHD